MTDHARLTALEAVAEAARKFANDVGGFLWLEEDAIRQAIGNTNYALATQRLADLDFAINQWRNLSAPTPGGMVTFALWTSVRGGATLCEIGSYMDQPEDGCRRPATVTLAVTP